VLRWRRPAALFVNGLTLLPLVLPLAPAKALLTRLLTRSPNCCPPIEHPHH
jgi:hypothetical protein